ncbi:hypothetical protein [Candidatus Tisiphia endosymbiont of Hybos culiciformis]|uniref:hypothetical protein n=1 Tax=Candidatus Tisiphia endosymbiont of Hybos culiciformis TaxID=3139331 RepID=UPI003CCADFC9
MCKHDKAICKLSFFNSRYLCFRRYDITALVSIPALPCHSCVGRNLDTSTYAGMTS